MKQYLINELASVSLELEERVSRWRDGFGSSTSRDFPARPAQKSEGERETELHTSETDTEPPTMSVKSIDESVVFS